MNQNKPQSLRQVPENELGPRHTEKTRFTTGGADLDIVISNISPRTYTNVGLANVNLKTDNGDFWHMVVINHKQLYTKQEILTKIFEVVTPNDFYPICYTQSKIEDYFLIRQSRAALTKLFQKNLRLPMNNGKQLFLTVKFEVAPFKLGHIYPAKVFQKAIAHRFNTVISWMDTESTLNLDNLANSPEMVNMAIDLGNPSALSLLSATVESKISTIDLSTIPIKGIRMTNNNLVNMSSFDVTSLQKIPIEMFDLRNNKFDTVEKVKVLAKYSISKLYIADNPVTQIAGYVADLRQTLPTVLRIDDVFSKLAILKPKTGGKTIALQYTGDIFDATDKEFNEKNFRKYKTSTRWHQVILHHEGRFNQEELLDAMYEIVAMNDFYPCYYQSDNIYDMFFVRECYEPLELLYVKRLQLKFSTRPEIVNITLKMNVADFNVGQVKPSNEIQEQLIRRFNMGLRLLDLSNLGFSDGFEDFVCRMSNPRTFSIIVSQASRRFLSNVEVLKLNNNGIRSARGTHSLVWMKSLKEIDLSNNNIADISAMESIPNGSYTDVWLQGNPLCTKYERARDYFDAVKSVIPSLQTLDGKDESQFDSMNEKQNFICTLDGYDFVEQFVEHYFNSFDSFNRLTFLKDLYHPQAISTISCNFIGMSDSLLKNFSAYTSRARNLVQNTDFDSTTNVFYGSENIVNLWSKLRQTRHDFKSFTIDMPSYTSTFVVINVNGVFKEENELVSERDNTLGFFQTFVIKKFAEGLGLFKNSDEYRIINEMVLFYRPSMKQLSDAFKIPSTPKMNPFSEAITAEDQKCMLIVLHDLTGLLPSWCKKLLARTSWNIKDALESFVELASNYQIPQDAYAFNKTMQ